MALDGLASAFTVSADWRAFINNTGTNLAPIRNNNRFTKRQTYSKDIANASLGGGDQFVSYLTSSIAAGASLTVDLTALTNVVGQASVTNARVKAIIIQLLSTTDDTTYGTLCSGAIVGYTGLALANPVELNRGAGSGLTLNVTAAAGAITVVAIVAAGSGYPPSSIFPVGVIQGAATQGLIAVTTNASGVPTAVAIINGGSGYTTASPLPTHTCNHTLLGKGGVECYFDQTSGGFTVDATHKNLRIANQDQAVAARLQITLQIGST